MTTPPTREFLADVLAEHTSAPPGPAPLEQSTHPELPPADPAVPSAHVAYAGNPHEGARSQGGYHLRLDQPFSAGRLERATGDPLCKPAQSFWGLEPCRAADRREPTCRSCIDRAQRYGITVRRAE
ncbi:hypothetical protein [Streptomyces sp. NPDC001404]|uniref:hypothetical protein n=1 Tax=Streptomyces sp. NPDC001404 TaxID=3364571 RepID=UPI0036C25600